MKTKRHINTICLPGGQRYLNPGLRCVVTGWGKTWLEEFGGRSPHLREGYVDFVSRNVCNSQKLVDILLLIMQISELNFKFP